MGNTCSGAPEEGGEINIRQLKSKQNTQRTEFKPAVEYSDEDKKAIVKIQAAQRGKQTREEMTNGVLKYKKFLINDPELVLVKE